MNRDAQIEALREGPDGDAADDIAAMFSALDEFNLAAVRLSDAGYDIELTTNPGIPGLMTLGETADSPIITSAYPHLGATIRREII